MFSISLLIYGEVLYSLISALLLLLLQLIYDCLFLSVFSGQPPETSAEDHFREHPHQPHKQNTPTSFVYERASAPYLALFFGLVC